MYVRGCLADAILFWGVGLHFVCVCGVRVRGHCTNFCCLGVIEPSRHSTVRHFMRSISISVYKTSCFVLFLPRVCGVNMNIDFSYVLSLPATAAADARTLARSLPSLALFLSLLVIEYNFALCRILLLLIAMRSVAFCLVV